MKLAKYKHINDNDNPLEGINQGKKPLLVINAYKYLKIKAIIIWNFLNKVFALIKKILLIVNKILQLITIKLKVFFE